MAEKRAEKSTVRSRVLAALEENKGSILSGELLATDLSVSRAAVWKAIKALQEAGYPITAATNSGYCLSAESDLLSAEGILPYLDESFGPWVDKIKVFQTVDSTNHTAKQLALNGAVHGTAVLADSQTAGRGRMGRSFHSPSQSGIYMSLILRPDFDITKSVLITTAASVAVTRAIQKICGVESQIKWVNDVYVEGKKVCGILTEAITDFESGQIESVILGIGVNCREPKWGLPAELAQIAGIVPNVTSKNALTAQIINEVLTLLATIEDRTFITEYKARSMVVGRKINVLKSNLSGSGVPATALGIDSDGGLIVKYDDGPTETLNTGEISIRLK